MPPKKSNLNNARSKEARRKRLERAHQSAEQTIARKAAQRVRTAEVRAQESQEQRDERLRGNSMRRKEARERNMAAARRKERKRQLIGSLTSASFVCPAFQYGPYYSAYSNIAIGAMDKDANQPSTSQEAVQLRRNVRSKKKCYDSSSESSDDNGSRSSRNLDEHQRTAKNEGDANRLDYEVTIKLEPQDDEEYKDPSHSEDKETDPIKSTNKSITNKPGNMALKHMHSIAPLLQNVTSYLESLTSKGDDFFDSFGKYVATMLRNMPKHRALKMKPQIIELIVSYSLKYEEDIKLEQDIKIEPQDS